MAKWISSAPLAALAAPIILYLRNSTVLTENAQHGADLFGGLPGGQELEDLALALGQRRARIAGFSE
jgi:hypothetical protein